VTITVKGVQRTRQLLGGTSYCAASDQRLLFGLGQIDKPDAVTVHWPSGMVTTAKDVASDRYITIREDLSSAAPR